MLVHAKGCAADQGPHAICTCDAWKIAVEGQLALAADPVNHPAHYKAHPSGIECIQVTEHMNFNLGNAVKYLWRADEKGDPIENLKKAVWYIQREIELRGRTSARDKFLAEVATHGTPDDWKKFRDGILG